VVECVPFNLSPDDINDLVRQAGNVLVAQVDGDARLLLLQFPRRLGSGAVVDVLAGVFKSRLGQRHDLVVRDGRGRVVAHGERARYRRSGSVFSDVIVAYMLFAWTATATVTVNFNQVRKGAPAAVRYRCWLSAGAASLLRALASLRAVRSRPSRLETSILELLRATTHAPTAF